MNHYSVNSRCECQAILTATIDDKRTVIAGAASRGGSRQVAPAHSMANAGDYFDVGWACPYCGRNILRSFHVGAARAA